MNIVDVQKTAGSVCFTSRVLNHGVYTNDRNR